MQEICTSGSEGGGTETNRSSLPLFVECPYGTNGGGIANLSVAVQNRFKCRGSELLTIGVVRESKQNPSTFSTPRVTRVKPLFLHARPDV